MLRYLLIVDLLHKMCAVLQSIQTVERAIRDAMEDWLDEYIIQINSDQKPAVDPVETALISIRSELEQLQHQQENICEYLEKGIYTIDVFLSETLP